MKAARGLTLGIFLASLGWSFAAAAAATSLPGPLVDAQWLKAHLSEVQVVDVRDQPETFTTPPRFTTDAKGKKHLAAVGGHIAGSRLLRFADIRTAREVGGRDIGFMRPSGYEFQSILQDAGVDGGKPLVVVSPADASESIDAGTHSLDMAARLYWTLKTFGTDQVAILNGGLAAWLQAGYPVNTEAAEPFPGSWTANEPKLDWTADSAATAAAVTHGVQLIDARPMPQFLGISKVGVLPKPGHIQGARVFPTDAIVRTQGIAAFYLDKAEYAKILPQLGISPSQPSITYCNTGHLAAGAWFVMDEIVGVPKTRMYDGSMLEWLSEGRPTVP